ncbi:MAG: polysaccharide deacetylase family protein [Phycisphaerales bacterium]|nr:polysaccharide deacetylase family protein [Phycisphaerales bacterium]
MASVVFYFQVHQPFRLNRYTVFDSSHFYFDTQKNGDICRKVADKCYRPATQLILDLVKRHKGRFRVSYAMTGVVLDQMLEFCPDVVDIFKRLADTGCCEFVGETYYHSLSFLYSRAEFAEQVNAHTRKIQELFGQTPRVFRNTELIFNNDLAHFISNMTDEGIGGKGDKKRWRGQICEGVDHILGYRSPNYVYRPPHTGDGPHGKPFGLLLKNYRLSDDIAFRFSNRGWSEWPLSAEKFAQWVDKINGDGFLCNLFMDYETFGEHQWADTGIFKFLDALPEKVFDVNPGHNHFNTPSEALEQFDPVGVYDVPHMISWADTERDLTAWLGNSMQSNALLETYKLERPIKDRLARALAGTDEHEKSEAAHLLEDWRKLTTSDHFYYMCTKYWSDGDVHKYFSPYDSPYDSYINFMNVLDNVRTRAADHRAVASASSR